MRRATGRHNQSAGDVYAEHQGVFVPDQSREERWNRANRAIAIIAVLLMPVVLVLALVAEAGPYWDQPEQSVVVTAAVPDGTITSGKVTCDASRFTVTEPAGRTGSFRACADERWIGDQLTARWRSSTSSQVAVDVLSWTQVLVIGALGLLVATAVGVGASWSVRRRRARLASPKFRTRRPRGSGGEGGAGVVEGLGQLVEGQVDGAGEGGDGEERRRRDPA